MCKIVERGALSFWEYNTFKDFMREKPAQYFQHDVIYKPDSILRLHIWFEIEWAS